MKERIKKLRKAKGLTQQEFANRLGIKRNTIANYEIGRNIPIDAVVSLICHTFNVSEAWLRTGEGGDEAMFLPNSEESLLSNPALNPVERSILRSYINAPDEVRRYMKQTIMDAALQAAPPQSAPSAQICEEKPDGLTDEEWAMVQRHRTAKDGSSTGAGSWDTDEPA